MNPKRLSLTYAEEIRAFMAEVTRRAAVYANSLLRKGDQDPYVAALETLCLSASNGERRYRAFVDSKTNVYEFRSILPVIAGRPFGTSPAVRVVRAPSFGTALASWAQEERAIVERYPEGDDGEWKGYAVVRKSGTAFVQSHIQVREPAGQPDLV